MAVTKISSSGNKQAGNLTGTDFVWFYFYSIKFITVGQESPW